MDSLAALFLILALLVGLAVGWLLRARSTAPLAAEKADLAARLETATTQRNAAIAELAVEQERVAQATAQIVRHEEAQRAAAQRLEQLQSAADARLQAVQAEREVALRDLAALQSDIQARTRAFEQQITALKDAKEQLSAQFSEIGGRLLETAQSQFLTRADQRFAQAHEKSEAQLKTLLSPVETTLKRYEEGLARVEKDRVGSYAELREAIAMVHAGQGQVREETAKLVNALRAAPKTRGRWGEQQFKNLIETAGLSPFVDFQEEVSVAVEDGRLRPDFIIRLPGDQQLVVDVKCSLEAYLNAVESVDGTTRDRFLADHARAVRTHADALGRKAYWEQFDKAPDFVIMYVPGDNFVTAALEADMDLWERAARNRVIICGPATFLPLARTLAGHWRQAKLQDQAKEVADLGKQLYERLATAATHLKRLGSGLSSAVDNYNKFVGSFDRSVLPAGRRFRDLNVETGGKEIEAVEPLELLIRDSQSDEARALPAAE
ncbi:DNA recombination protein RmuC [Sphingobium lactosutens]|uniref:DNA recombination protein RmuC homolog n=1 Tax=Sphingobium lactosutens DS20 TaxID=1331060 RepID=T0HMI5_9SPHN|nr:DNA recombination protein RmuC [Sphingobium lactosutens]EQB14217.1 DNA recombination protein RmuC [Sphingobium lactosutens DS20]